MMKIIRKFFYCKSRNSNDKQKVLKLKLKYYKIQKKL